MLRGPTSDPMSVALTRHADGDSLPRPFALFLRKSPALSHLHDERQAGLPMCSIEDS
jgi:hypothetical protein